MLETLTNNLEPNSTGNTGHVYMKYTSTLHGEGSIAITSLHNSFVINSHFIILFIVDTRVWFLCSDDGVFFCLLFITCTVLIGFA